MPVLPEAILTPALAFGISVVAVPLFSALARRTGFVDQPSARKIHTRPIPLLGGLGVYLAVMLALLLRAQLDARVVWMMAASVPVMLIGIADDRWDISSRYRLVLQGAVATGLSLAGVRFHFLPFELLNHLVTVLWLVGVINAMNCLDCADGATGGTCAAVFVCLGALALSCGRVFVWQASLAGAGAVAGFLLYNIPPARVFMGDAGSTFLGLMVGVLAVLAAPANAGPGHVPLGPLVVLVPVLDFVWVHFRRYQAGIRSFRDVMASTGKDHLPHRLLVRGLSKFGVMLAMALLSVLAGVAAFGLANQNWMLALVALISLVAFLWHLEEDARIVIRDDDRCALFVVDEKNSRNEMPVRAALHREESV